MTIAEVSRAYDISADTLRYMNVWASCQALGVLPAVSAIIQRRTAAGWNI